MAGDADVLLCTTIIESGLDIPNANTIIIDHADKLGLAQLYQLRGRVGRAANRAYAYFLYHAGRKVTDTARERLSVIEQATELGAGFRIALKDLEIRGAGNLLGPEQSGQMASVGLDLYTRMLASAVERARAERRSKNTERLGLPNDEWLLDEDEALAPEGTPSVPLSTPTLLKPATAQLEEPPTVSLDLPLTAYLPEEYVPDDAVRLRVYQRMAASMSDAQIRDLRRELEDRFGSSARTRVEPAGGAEAQRVGYRRRGREHPYARPGDRRADPRGQPDPPGHPHARAAQASRYGEGQPSPGAHLARTGQGQVE